MPRPPPGATRSSCHPSGAIGGRRWPRASIAHRYRSRARCTRTARRVSPPAPTQDRAGVTGWRRMTASDVETRWVLDRAGHLRKDTDALETELRARAGLLCPLWRDLSLIAGDQLQLLPLTDAG